MFDWCAVTESYAMMSMMMSVTTLIMLMMVVMVCWWGWFQLQWRWEYECKRKLDRFNRNRGSAARLEPSETGHGKESCRSLMILRKTFKSNQKQKATCDPIMSKGPLYLSNCIGCFHCVTYFVRKPGHCFKICEEQQPQRTRPIKPTREYAHAEQRVCVGRTRCWISIMNREVCVCV